jgi:hypothetical protein
MSLRTGNWECGEAEVDGISGGWYGVVFRAGG